MAFALLATVLVSAASAAQRSPKLLASDAGRLYRTAQTYGVDTKGEAYYRILMILDVIRANHPNSIEAAVLRTGRVLNTAIELPEVEATGNAWADSNPDDARALKNAVVAQAAADAPTDSSDQDVATKSDDDRVDKGVVAKLDDRTRAIKVPPPAKNRLLLPDDRQDAAKTRSTTTVTGPARKVSRGEVFAHLERSVVLVLYVAEQKGELFVVGTGTGFFISPSRILTNAHVAGIQSDIWDEYKAEGFFLVVNQHIGVREARIATIATRDTSLNIDAALLETVGFRSEDHLTFAGEAQIGEWIAIGGFPGKATDVDAAMSGLVEFIERRKEPPVPDNAIPTLRVDDGILSNKYVNKQSRALTLQYSLETTGGNSGSPIVNACGEVIGLHYSGSRERAMVQKSNDGDFFVDVDASKYNSAVASKELRYFLDRVSQPAKFNDDPCQVG